MKQEALEFFGQFLAYAFIKNLELKLAVAPMFWKLLSGHEPNEKDLFDVDFELYSVNISLVESLE